MRVGLTIGLIAAALLLGGCFKGDKGDKGDAGPPGPVGQKGDIGQKGEPGQKAEPGQKGEKGDRGDKGDRGEKGDKGDSGIAGVVGAPGAVGQRGEKGEKGDKGDRGERGDGIAIRVQRVTAPACGAGTPCTLTCNDDEELISASCIGGGVLDVRPKDATCSSNPTGLMIACVRR